MWPVLQESTPRRIAESAEEEEEATKKIARATQRGHKEIGVVEPSDRRRALSDGEEARCQGAELSGQGCGDERSPNA